MTIASTNENDVSAIVKKIDPKNKIRFEPNAIKKSAIVHKVIINRVQNPKPELHWRRPFIASRLLPL